MTHAQIGFCTHQTVQVSMTELPPSLEYLRQNRIKENILAWCDLSQTKAHTQEQHDGLEAFTVVTHLSGSIRLLGLYTGVQIAADRRSCGDTLRVSSFNRMDSVFNRMDSVVKSPKYTAWFSLNDLSHKYIGGLVHPRHKRRLDAFEHKVLTKLRQHSPHMFTPNGGGSTRCHIDLRGLDISWVPPLIRNCPRDPSLVTI